ncbi:biopolymer transporter ExbD [candidate division WOR-3 bacterium]|nr:biopolymer transporter ExbD [candidate division WOR-3 bacterium]
MNRNAIFESEIENAVGRIPITPMINVALLLVLFFMMSAPAIFMSGIKVKSPSLTTEPGTEATELKVNIYIDAEGDLYLNEELIQWDEFSQRVAELLARSTTRIVVVSAAPHIPIQKVVTVLDIARQKGALKLALLRRKE